MMYAFRIRNHMFMYAKHFLFDMVQNAYDELFVDALIIIFSLLLLSKAVCAIIMLGHTKCGITDLHIFKFSFQRYIYCTDSAHLDDTSNQCPTFAKYGTQISHDKGLQGGNFGDKVLTSLLNCLLNRASFGNRHFAALDVL